MTKIDFLKVEVELSKAVHTMFVKDIMDQKPTLSKAFVEFFRLNDAPRPKPIDPVIQGLDDLVAESQQDERKTALFKSKESRKQELISQGIVPKEAEEIIEEEIEEDLRKEREKSFSTTPQPTSVTLPEKVPTKEDVEKPVHPIVLLKRHILWMRKKKIEKIYESIGITEEEFKELRQKEIFTPQEERRIVELLEKAKAFKQQVIEKLGLQDDEKVIEAQRKKHINKRFNVKESWLPLQ